MSSGLRRAAYWEEVCREHGLRYLFPVEIPDQADLRMMVLLQAYLTGFFHKIGNPKYKKAAGNFTDSLTGRSYGRFSFNKLCLH